MKQNKIVSGNKFEVLRNLKYDEPLRSTIKSPKAKNSFPNFKSVKLKKVQISPESTTKKQETPEYDEKTPTKKRQRQSNNHEHFDKKNQERNSR